MAKGQKNMEWAVEREVLTVGQDQGQSYGTVWVVGGREFLFS